MTKRLAILLLVLMVASQTAWGDWHFHHGRHGSSPPGDPDVEAFLDTVSLIIAASIAILFLGGPVLIIWTRRARDAFWLVPSVNLLLYVLSIRLRSYPGGFTARFRPPGLWYTIGEIFVLLLISLAVAAILAGIRWLVRRIQAIRGKPDSQVEPVGSARKALSEPSQTFGERGDRDHSLWGHVAGLALTWFRSFAGTVLLFIVLGVAMSAMSLYVLRESMVCASIAAAVALVEAVAIGLLLGSKRAVAVALAHGIGRLQLGRAAVRKCFQHLLQPSPEEGLPSTGGQVIREAKCIPLAQAEKRLSGVIDDLLGVPPDGGGISSWLRRKLHERLLRLVQTCTLARFREEGTKEGAVDLVKLQTDLESRMDDILVTRLKRGLNLWTLLAVLGLLVVVCVQVCLLLARLHSQ
jgi:hypothetical protein